MKGYLEKFKSFNRFWELPVEKQKVVTLGEEVFTCQMLLPVMPKKEVAEAIRWELPLHVPYEEGSYYFAYEPLGLSDGMQKLQVYVVLKSVVQNLEEAAILQGCTLVEVNVSGSGGKLLNLLPDSKKRKLLPLKKLYRLGTISVLLLGTFLLTGAWCYKTLQVYKLQEVQAKLQGVRLWQKRFEKQEARLQKIKVLSSALAKLEKERVVWSELLPAIGECTPENCWFTTIKQREASKMVELQGKAKDVEQIKILLANLQASKNLSKVTLLETSSLKGELVGYKIVVQGKGKGE